ncbi:hypothetical protein HPT25_27335 [Bacillus sp. BRMEA1]|uniref:hypothetical protein n=1 Tax=Neobacillus endophyticus TaxID=2738405 RepID=UPI0015662B65|nr:hypothetical protein [Neobacillus endophyticus]NRD81035.1 hypothetical protein [Neobacillus endophyticus]
MAKLAKLKKILSPMAVATAIYSGFSALFPSLAFAASTKSAWSSAGISPSSSTTSASSGLFKDLTSLVNVVMAFGGFWIIACLVWGGMTLAGSGGNPQKRTEGFIKLALVFVGGWIIMKSYTIAGWVAGFGS